MRSVQPNVLVVDDDELTLEGLRRGLSKEATITTASSGAAALELAARTKFEVVLTDLIMPGLNGFALIEKLRLTQPDTICVVLTGSVVNPFPKGLPSNVLVCRSKPCPLTEIIESIHGALAEFVLRRANAELESCSKR